ncbi:MAG: hypothetical protein BWX88_03623 [Planctomycetes bacterium ADurb.Bin126]|nr:MAG: hypothetical protein BWX88_03623 [Planctomycetes bacterium ADurb.Bin126]
MEHGELVVAFVAFDGRLGTDALAEIAAGRLDRFEGVERQQARARIPFGAEQLADLEGVVAGPADQRRNGAVVVEREIVVAAQGLDDQPVQTLVVLDPLDLVRAAVGLDLADRALQQRHERRRLRALAGNAAHPAQQEDIGVGRSVDGQDIVTVAGRSGVQHIDDVVAVVWAKAAERVDFVCVAVGLAVECQGVASRGNVGRAGRDDCILEEVHQEPVLSVISGSDQVLASVGAGLRAEIDVAGRTPGGRPGAAGAVAELEGVGAGVAPEPSHVLRCCEGGGGRADRAGAGLAAGRTDRGPGDDPPAQDHGRPRPAVRIAGGHHVVRRADVAVEVDVFGRRDLAVRLEGDVIAYPQQH